MSIPSDDFLYDEAACGLALTAKDGTILKVNLTFCQWLGYERSELVSKRRLQDLFNIGGRFFHHTHWAPLLDIQRSVAEVQIDMVRKDGTEISTLINARKRVHGSEEFSEIAVFVAADRKKYERELLRARKHAEQTLSELRLVQAELESANTKLSNSDRRKDEFLATLAHELRNPLAPIVNVLELLKLKGTIDENVIWARNVIDRHVSQLTHLTNDLLEVSRITQGRLELRKAILDLNPLITQAIEASQPLINESGHELICVMPEEKIFVEGDSTRLIQIFSNLITNAAKYTPKNGRIEIALELREGAIDITVSDNGIGIAANELQNIFGMFSQLAPTATQSHGGLGIGLALVRGLVELHGGKVEAFSDGEGKGSRFVVTLPICMAKTAEVEPAATKGPARELRRNQVILIVDDNIDAAESLSSLLTLLGHVTHVAYQGKAALDIAGRIKPSTIILDIGLPDIIGHEVAKRIRATQWGQSTLLIAASGWGQKEDKKMAKDSGFDFHLTKPIDLNQLYEILNTQGNI